jgi:hypothetical protein
MISSLLTTGSIQNFQAQLLAFTQYLNSNIAPGTLVVSSSTPTPTQRNQLWLRVITGTGPNNSSITAYDKIYKYDSASGMWLSPHSIATSSNIVSIWDGSLDSLYAFDGGDGTDPTVPATAPTAVTGSFWQVDQNITAKFPIGATVPGTGTLFPSGAAPPAEGVSGGFDAHALSVLEMPAHTHPSDPGASAFVQETITGEQFASSTGGHFSNIPNTGSTGGDTPFSLLPPYYGVFFIQRTARQFYSLPG